MGRLALFFIVLLFAAGCAHKNTAHEPKNAATAEEDDYPMLEDEDVGISRGNQDKSAQTENSAASNP